MLTPTQRFVDQGTDLGTDLGAYLTATISFADGGGVLWPQGNDQHVLVEGLTRQPSGTVVSGATVELTVYGRRRGDPVGGASWPVQAEEQTAGTYKALISESVQIEPFDFYWVEIAASKGQADATYGERVRAEPRDLL